MPFATPKFDAPRTTTLVLSRDIWVKGKGLPAAGICLFKEGEEVTLQTDNGAQWYLLGHWHGHEVRVATIPSTL